MPILQDSVGEELSREFRQKMYEFYVYTEYAKGAVVSEPLRYSKRSNMLRVQQNLLKEMRVAEERALKFAHVDIPRAHAAGWRAAHDGKDVKYNQQALRELLGDPANDKFNGIVSRVEKDVSKAFLQTRAETVRIVRDWRILAEDMKGAKSIAGVRQRFERARKNIMKDKISPLVYPGGYKTVMVKQQMGGEFQRGKKAVMMQKEVPYDVRWKFNTYMDTIGRYHSQVAYNRGYLSGLSALGTKAVRISDGPDCGLKSHDDPQKANGMVMNLDDARRYTVAHPNCVRDFAPVSNVPAPPDIEQGKGSAARTKVSQAFHDYAKIFNRVAEVNVREFIVDTTQQTANFLISDLVRDQQFRRDSIEKIIANHPDLRRIDQEVNRIVAAASQKLGRPVSKMDVNANIERWVEKAIEDPHAMKDFPPHVQRALGVKFQEMVTAHGKELQQVSGDNFRHFVRFGDYKELFDRGQMTHQQLNVTNSVESSYGEKFFKDIANSFFNENVRVEKLQGFMNRYAPSGAISDQRRKQLAREAARFADKETKSFAQSIWSRKIKTPADRMLADYLPIPEGAGRVRLIRVSSKDFRLKHLGLRYEMDKRFLKVQTGNVNRLSMLNIQELRKVAEKKGVKVTEEVLRQPRNIQVFRDAKGQLFSANDVGRWLKTQRYRSRKDVLDEVGYNVGLLTRITIKPHELVRLGFRWDPATGWKKPLPQLSISSPKLGPFTVRTALRLNRGFSIANDARMGSREVLKGFQNRPSLVDGVRLRTVTQEVSIALGGLLDANKYFKVGKIVLPGITNLGMRSATLVGRMNSMADAKNYVKTVGIKGFYQDMAVLNFFAEWKMLGWSWLRIARVTHITPQEISAFAQAFNKVWAHWREEAAMTTLLTHAWVQAHTPGANVDAISEYVARYEAVLHKQKITKIEMAKRIKKYRDILLAAETNGAVP